MSSTTTRQLLVEDYKHQLRQRNDGLLDRRMNGLDATSPTTNEQGLHQEPTTQRDTSLCRVAIFAS
jgi:hypothetical protein